MKKLLLLLIIPFLSFGQQSKSYKYRPDNVMMGNIRTSNQLNKTSVVLISNVPSYLWHRGCGPTALAMVIGYYDNQEYDDLIPGVSSIQNGNVNNSIASSAHYLNYSLPYDEPPNLLEDASSLGGTHQDNCIADFMKTSFSSFGNYWAWSRAGHMDDAFKNYVYFKNSNYITNSNFYINSGADTWMTYVDEIDNNRPTVLLVDLDGDGSTDHFIVGIGYDIETLEFAAYDTWDNEIHWYSWKQLNIGVEWGVHSLMTFEIIDIVSSELDLRIWPNPANEYINIEIDFNTQPSELVMISEQGYIYIQKDISNIISGQEFNLDIANIPAGKYIVTIKDNGQYLAQKIIIL